MGVAIGFMAAALPATPSSVTADDDQGIQTTLDAVGATLARMDFDAFGGLFTDDADFVNIVGMHWSVRATGPGAICGPFRPIKRRH